MKRLLLCIALSALAATQVGATTFFVNLDNPNAGLVPYPPSFTSIQIDVPNGGGNATIIASGLSHDNYNYLLGAEGLLGLNLTTAATASGITFTGGSGSTLISPGGAGNISSFGNFNFSLNGFDGFGAAVTSVSFVLTPSSGTFANAASVLTPNASGYEAATHVFVAGPGCTGACVTGFAANGGTITAVPDIRTMATVGSGILLIGISQLRKKKKQEVT